MGNKRILVIDDEKMNIISLAHFLKPQYELIVAVDGVTGFEAAEKHIPDLILLDVIMPEVSGFDIIVKLKESEKTSHIPVIFLTGLSNAADEEKGLSLGAVDYIPKPFNKALVKKRIDTQIKMTECVSLIKRLGKHIENDASAADLTTEIYRLLSSAEQQD